MWEKCQEKNTSIKGNEITMKIKRRYHITVDGYKIDRELLSDKNLIEKVTRGLVEICKMKILYGPVVIQGVEENPGLTCFTIIDFSHISIHTFTDSLEICVDVFSCKDYDFDSARKYIQKMW